MKRCKSCKTEKPLDAFSVHRSCSGGYRPTCKECRNIKYAAAAEAARRSMSVVEKTCTNCGETKGADGFPRHGDSPDGLYSYCLNCKKDQRFRRMYGITLNDAIDMAAAQGGRCAVCEDELPETPHVDHCHETGLVRGILCPLCNKGLGHFKDRVEVLEAAVRYLQAANNVARNT